MIWITVLWILAHIITTWIEGLAIKEGLEDRKFILSRKENGATLANSESHTTVALLHFLFNALFLFAGIIALLADDRSFSIIMLLMIGAYINAAGALFYRWNRRIILSRYIRNMDEADHLSTDSPAIRDTIQTVEAATRAVETATQAAYTVVNEERERAEKEAKEE